MKDCECPYCDAEVEICHDDGYGYDEDTTHHQECGECGRTFAYTTAIHFTYEASKADCLNGTEHVMKPVAHRPDIFTHWNRCRDCGLDDKGPVDPAKYDRYFNGAAGSPNG